MNSASATNNQIGTPTALPKDAAFRDLSGPRQALVRLFQNVNFGHVDGLEVCGGEPVFNPAPAVFVELKLDAEETPRSERDLHTFDLRSEVVRLLAELDRLGNGTVERIDIRYGIPRRVVLQARLEGVLQ